MSFWDARFLWQEPLLAAVIAAAVLGYLGFFVVLRRIAFMSAALSQVSGLGVAVAFFAGSFLGISPHDPTPWWLAPTTFALFFASAGAMLMALVVRSKRVSSEAVVALSYLAAAAFVMVVLASPRIAQEAHEVGDLLFGNAVVVKRGELVQLLAAGVITLVLHALFFKEFLFCSFDPETAKVFGVPVPVMDVLLHLNLAVCVAIATKALGALPVFAFLVLPAGAALLFSERLKPVVALSVGLSVVAAALGYYLSWTLSLPTGSVMVALAACFWAVAGIKRFVELRR